MGLHKHDLKAQLKSQISEGTESGAAQGLRLKSMPLLERMVPNHISVLFPLSTQETKSWERGQLLFWVELHFSPFPPKAQLIVPTKSTSNRTW